MSLFFIGKFQNPNILSSTPVTRLNPEGITSSGSLAIYNSFASGCFFKKAGELELKENNFPTIRSAFELIKTLVHILLSQFISLVELSLILGSIQLNKLVFEKHKIKP